MDTTQKSVFTFDGKAGIIVGGSRGIGKATALELAKYGANIVVAARNVEEAEAVAQEISQLGRECLVATTNIRRKEEIQPLVDKVIAKFGRIDFLVNSAATTQQDCDLVDLDEWAWDVTMNTNLKAYFLLSQAVGRIMIKQKRGAIVNVAGISGLWPEKYVGAYSISKAAVMHLTRALAGELGPYNIRVNAIAPGLTRTQFARRLREDEEGLRNYLNRCALQRIAEPEEQARGIVYLLSDYASYVNGHVLVIDGGWQPNQWFTLNK